jgi:hypothetical protein
VSWACMASILLESDTNSSSISLLLGSDVR